MSEQQTAEAAATESEASTEQAEQPKPTETVDFWKQKAREQEKRAKANADAATKLAQIEEAQKSEAEKTADRIKQLENEAQDARREALRFKVASQFGIDADKAELLLTGPDEETMTKQAQAFADVSATRKKAGNVSPREGSQTRPAPDAKREFLRDLTGAD